MDLMLYRGSLLAAIPLMLFFGMHMLLARIPDKKNCHNYLLSRRLMGLALLVLTSNYLVHLLFVPRMSDQCVPILLNMMTYFLCYWLFCAGMMTLLDKNYVTRKRFFLHLGLWLAYCTAGMMVLLFIRDRNVGIWLSAILALCLIVYGLLLSMRILRSYSSAVKAFDQNNSDDIGAYIKWLSVFTYWAIAFGVSCGLLTFIPNRFVWIWVLSAIPFYIYLYCCYHNYLFFYEKVETAIEESREPDIALGEAGVNGLDSGAGAGRTESRSESNGKASRGINREIAHRIDKWTKDQCYTKPGLTIKDMAQELGTNRTYLSEYINTNYGMNFRDWISWLRIDYAKSIMKQDPYAKMSDVSEAAGFLSVSHFSRTFSEKEGCSPASWRKEQL